ncbi:D-alanyl-D-alanine carboxypeptidase/D-alanyl-D-alanine-endopeptidase [Glycomyces halotolerans]
MRKRTIITSAAAIGAATALGIAGTVVAQAQHHRDDPLAEAIDAIIDDPRLTDSQIGVRIADADTGEILYDHDGAQRIVPASNNKLATSAAALEILGPDHTFTTDLAAETAPSGGAVDGDLYLRGTGDPTLLEADFDALAAELAASGVTEIDGDVVADDTAFDSERLGTEWGWSDLQYLYASEVSALTVASGDDYNAGTVRVFVDPGAGEGEPAGIRMVPANDHVTIVNDAVTTEPGTGTSIAINRDDHANTVRVTGTIGVDSYSTYGTRSVIDPAGLAGDVLAGALERHGISVEGEVRTGESTPASATVLASRHSMPLSELTVHFLKRSNSSHAEALFKTLGYERSGHGTFATGKAAVYAGIEKYGVDTGPVRQVDGSGLSRHNLVSPAMVTDLLIGAKDAPWFDTWYAALPIACESDPLVGGTLSGRMCGTPAAGNAHAKTGSMTSVSALSGYVTDADGRHLAFSVMANDYLWSTVKDVEDRIVAALAAHSDSATESQMRTFGNLDQIETPEPVGEPAGDQFAELECSWIEPAVC